MIDNQKLLNDLLAEVKKFYPIDWQMPNEEYSGFQNVHKLIEDKIRKLLAGEPLVFDNIIKELNFNNSDIIKERDMQAPCYGLTLIINEQKSDYIKSTSFLKLRVSQLTNCYTLFYEELILVDKLLKNYPIRASTPPNVRKERYPIMISCVSRVNHFADPDRRQFNILQGLVEKYYPGYQFADAILLFKTMINGTVPFGAMPDDENPYPLYSFLFNIDCPLTTPRIYAE